jgi:dihydroorotase
MGIPAGTLGINHCADIVIFNAETYWKVEATQLKSQGKNTPFLNLELAGRVHYTLVEGLITYEPSSPN